MLVQDRFDGKYKDNEAFQKNCKLLKKEFENTKHL